MLALIVGSEKRMCAELNDYGIHQPVTMHGTRGSVSVPVLLIKEFRSVFTVQGDEKCSSF